MLVYLKTLSTQRSGWFLLLLSATALLLTALYFQHGMGLQPCVMCIYERVALLGIILAGFIGILYPASLLLRLLALAIGLWSAIKGLLITLSHVDLQRYPAPWKQCATLVDFPETLPLDRWFPALFNPTGSCTEISWQFLGFSMVEWLVVVFGFYSLLLTCITFSQVKRLRPKQRRLFR